MAAGYDIGASSSTSSGVQGGTINTGDFIVGGSGGASKTPTWIFIVGGLVLVLGIFAFMLMGTSRK